MSRLLSRNETAWLEEHFAEAETVKALTDCFNATFHQTRTVDVIKNHCRARGLRRDVQHFTPDHDAWLKENAPGISVRETARQFNARFGANRSEQVLKWRCNKVIGVRHKGQRINTNKMAVGTENKLGRYWFVKTSDDATGRGSFYRNWAPKSRVLWEREHGKVLDGYMIVFLDGNPDHCTLDNLYAVSGKVHREMSKNRWYTADRDTTLAAIKCCELWFLAKERGGLYDGGAEADVR